MFTDTTVLTTPELVEAYKKARSKLDLEYETEQALDAQWVWWELHQTFQAAPAGASVFWTTEHAGDCDGMQETLAALRVVGCMDSVPFHPEASGVASAVERLLHAVSASHSELFYEMLELGGCSLQFLQGEWLQVCFGEYGAARVREAALDDRLPSAASLPRAPRF